MWKRLKDTFYFLFFDTSEGYRISVTNFSSIWSKHLDEEPFVNEAKKSNRHLKNINSEELRKNIIEMLANPDKMKNVKINVDINMLQLTVSTMQYRYPVHFTVALTEGSKVQFFQEVTQQLLLAIFDLRSSEKELRTELLKKDAEITAYKEKCSTDKVAKYLKTTVYNDEEHMTRHTVYKEVFSEDPIPQCLLSIQVPKRRSRSLSQGMSSTTSNMATPDSNKNIKVEPINTDPDQPTVNIKQEPNSQTFEELIKEEDRIRANDSSNLTDDQNNSLQSNIKEVLVNAILSNQDVKRECKSIERVTGQTQEIVSNDVTADQSGGFNTNIKREQTNSQTSAVTPRKKRKGLNF